VRWPGSHGAAAIGLQVSWPFGAGDLVVASSNDAANKVAFSRSATLPADDAPAENVYDEIEIEVGPFGWPHQLGIPGSDLVGHLRQQLRIFIDWIGCRSRLPRSRTSWLAARIRYMVRIEQR
jgi:hypothetical protein